MKMWAREDVRAHGTECSEKRERRRWAGDRGTNDHPLGTKYAKLLWRSSRWRCMRIPTTRVILTRPCFPFWVV